MKPAPRPILWFLKASNSLAIITLIIVLAKLDLRVAVLEEKVKQLFEMWNKK